MAFRGTAYWRSMVTRMGGNRPYATSTAPKMKLFTQTVDSAHANHSHSKFSATGEFAPIYVLLGLVTVVLSIGTHTAKQQLAHHPTVSISKKKRRAGVPEVENPERALNSSDKFLRKSYLRKVASIQEHDRVLPDTSRRDPFTIPRNADSPKVAGP